VKTILSNEKYVGTMTYNKTSERLSSPKKKNPSSEWITKEKTIKPIIEKRIFEKAQKIIKSNIRIHSKDYLVNCLQMIYERHGRISTELINTTKNTPSPSAYRRVFGTIKNAYAQVGYTPFIDENPHKRKLFSSNELIIKVSEKIIKICRNQALKVKKLSNTRLEINNSFVLQLAVFSRTNAHPGYRLFLKKNVNVVLAFGSDGDWHENDIYLFPRSITQSNTFYINKRKPITLLDDYRTGWGVFEVELWNLAKSIKKQ
jgi:hypothetical protein